MNSKIQETDKAKGLKEINMFPPKANDTRRCVHEKPHMFSHSSLSIAGLLGRAAPGTEQNVILTSGGSGDFPLRTQPENYLQNSQAFSRVTFLSYLSLQEPGFCLAADFSPLM